MTVMEQRTFQRVGSPVHIASLTRTLAPLLAVANAGSFHIRQQRNEVVVSQKNFNGVDLVAVQAAVSSEAEDSAELNVMEEMKTDVKFRALAVLVGEKHDMTESEVFDRLQVIMGTFR